MNEGWVVGRLIRLLATAPGEWLPLGYDIPDLIEKLVLRWSWFDYVMASLEHLTKT